MILDSTEGTRLLVRWVGVLLAKVSTKWPDNDEYTKVVKCLTAEMETFEPTRSSRSPRSPLLLLNPGLFSQAYPLCHWSTEDSGPFFPASRSEEPLSP
jgi:hypothetical protein